MDVQIEFNGLVKEIVGTKQISLTFEEGATYSDVVEKIGRDYPDLIDIIIEPNRRCLLNANFFSRGEEDVIFPTQMEEKVQPGEKLILISIIVGG
ncbi:MAG: MoaD/ThiS family protein [Anaerolineaceae bacterium]